MTGKIHRLGYEAIHTYWDRALPPRLVIDPGDSVVLATREPSQGMVARDVAAGAIPTGLQDLVALVAASDSPPVATGPGTELGGHALTGPIAVAGAEPGDALIVEVISVVPAAWGWTACGPGEDSFLGGEVDDWALHLWDLRDGQNAVFLPGIQVPISPFCGVMGVAPSEQGRHRTAPPRRVGGNLDVPQLCAGAALTLPVEVPGALFSAGDAHAAQGDGEVAGTGIEIDATVTLRFELVKGAAPPGPRFRASKVGRERGPWFASVGSDTDPREAARQALRGVLSELERHHGLTRQQGILLASACVDLRINQLVNAGTWTVSAFLPLDIFVV